MVSEYLVSSSTTLVWCTVSTKLESEADPSVVLRRVGPNTKHLVIIHITHSHLTSPTYCEVAGRHVVCVRVLGDPGQVLTEEAQSVVVIPGQLAR